MLTLNSGVSNTAAAEAARKVLEIAVPEEMGKTLAVSAAVFVKPQAFLHDLDTRSSLKIPGSSRAIRGWRPSRPPS